MDGDRTVPREHVIAQAEAIGLGEAEVAFMHTTLSLSRIGGTGAPSAFPDDGSNLARLPPCPLNPYQALL